MIRCKLVNKPAFDVVGKKTWVSGQDNSLFAQFWVDCQNQRLFELFEKLRSDQPGLQTNSSMMGISCVEQDPANRAFHYMIAIEMPGKFFEELEIYRVPAAQWAVFECIGKVPESIVKAEMYAFTSWLPASDYEHAKAPEMEVYFHGNDGSSDESYCEFWLPITEKSRKQDRS